MLQGLHEEKQIKFGEQGKLIVYLVAGTTARCVAGLIGVNRNMAAYYFQRPREIIACQLEQASHEVFEGGIEVDESYYDGTRQTRSGSIR